MSNTTHEAPERIWALSARRKIWQDEPPQEGQQTWHWIEYVRADHIEELELKVKNLRKALEIYERERDRFKHANPEMTGAYFLTGGHGPKDENGVPMYIEICPAYGCAWTYVYQTTGRTISYEGS